jgi:SAM-dependent methyltransferase
VTEPDHWFEPIAEHLGGAYLRYSFTKGTVQEIDFLVRALGLVPGQRVLDVGCGPGRHAYELAHRGIMVHGIDISARFVDLARRDAPIGATFERLDARAMSFIDEFDAVICLCQGAFGLMNANGDDQLVLAAMAAALRPSTPAGAGGTEEAGGLLALSAFSSYFAVKYHDAAAFDADTGVSHERTEVRSETGSVQEVDLWTGCYTPRELRLLMASVGMQVLSLTSVEPGGYGSAAPSVETPEFLVIAQRG